MKMRLMGLLLTVCMVFALFSCMATGALADVETVTYTMTSGDTVIGVCQAKGLDFFACKDVIMSLNGFTGMADFSRIQVGQVIKLPASNEAAASAGGSASGGSASGGTSSGETASGGSTSGSAGTGTISGSLLAGDTIVYYLLPHTMVSGETVYGVCNELGVNFGVYSWLIKSVSGITNFNYVRSGQVILLPVSTAPAGGFAVVAHTLVSGDTAYGLCQSYNISYSDSQTVLKGLNGTNNLASLRVGQVFLIPVGVKAGSSSGGSASGDATVTTYAISSGSAEHGSFKLQVGGADVTAAAAGKTVSIVATAEDGYAVENYTVAYSDGSATLPVKNGTFTMPAAPVKVSVTFTAGYALTKGSIVNGGLELKVNGSAATTATAGQTVTIVTSPNAGYMVNLIQVVDAAKNSYTVTDGTFVMPATDVTVGVTYKVIPTYGFTKTACENGSFILTVKGSEVTTAAEDVTVTVAAAPAEGYELATVTVTDSDSNEVAVSSGTFKMPAGGVTVTVTFNPAA